MGFNKESVKHGMFGTPEYTAWAQMIQRCINPKHPAFKRYGGRGIIVCKKWRNFVNFFADMGFRPGPSYSLDRIDNDSDYVPENCRWATGSQQNKNKSYAFVQHRPRDNNGRFLSHGR